MKNDHESNKHPLIKTGLPDWLASVPLKVPKPDLVDIGEGKKIGSDHILAALSGEVGTIHLGMSILPELVDTMVEFTENESWRNLPTEPYTIERTAENSWLVRVGEYRASFGRETLDELLAQAMNDPDKPQH